MFENSDQLGLELRAVAKHLGFGQGGQQGFGHRIFGPVIIAQLQSGKADQLHAVLNQLVFKSRHGGSLTARVWSMTKQSEFLRSGAMQSRNAQPPMNTSDRSHWHFMLERLM